jgi:phosphatidylserine/phosphatidylglycerophosphate/cardiolipin synthase-like enzyme
VLSGLAPIHLEKLADGLSRAAFHGDVTAIVRGMELGSASGAVVAEIAASLAEMPPATLAAVLRAVAEERRSATTSADRRLELVWTGPERDATATRDTSVVVRELFQTAERDVLVAGYALYNARAILEPLTQRMLALPALRVRVILNVARDEDEPDEAATLREFGRRFRTYHWPAARLPAVYYDPRAFEPRPERRAVMHAKCVVVDGRRTFLTSANLTEAAQVRNIELGVVINDPAWSRLVTHQFNDLIARGELRELSF